ncbi:MAG: hypothetical protein JOY71_15900 [Acetobacteraceae bacterium]|nr:hypothetical protein [Acetobacteraceae bacterium]MBV8523584.1 hypothetical protein [Acetobacteraceae bacterium]MBV8589318.1 hypothetical protein [Acetobacteraceae bacterium]
MRRAAGLLVLTMVLAAAGPAYSQAPTGERGQPGRPSLAPQPGQAPFGDAIAEALLPAYNRAMTMIGTCGPIGDTGVIEAKRVGFASIVDLRPAGDASRSEQARAQYSRLRSAAEPALKFVSVGRNSRLCASMA